MAFGLLACAGPGLRWVTLLLPAWQPGVVALGSVPRPGSELVTRAVAVLCGVGRVLQGFVTLCVLKSFLLLLFFFFYFFS